MSKPAFVYTTYIRTTPEQLWQALTDPAFTRRYWGIDASSPTGQVGSTMTWEQHGVTIADPEQVVLEADPSRRLVVHVAHVHAGARRGVGFSDEHARGVRRRAALEGDVRDRAARGEGEADRHPRRLRRRQRGAAGISGGWPAIVANLKTLLETGETLPAETLSAR